MSHQQFDQLMQNLAVQNNGKPAQFLTAFSPIHVFWHVRGRGAIVNGVFQPIGFLTFHHSVIQAYSKVLQSANRTLPNPIVNWGPPYDVAIDNISDPVGFSSAIENWHNGVHNSDMTLMNPATNIRKRRFWQLHNFIDGKFTTWQQTHRVITSAEHQTV